MIDYNAKTKSLPAKKTLLIVGIILIAANLRPAITSPGPLIDYIRADMQLSSFAAGLLTTIPLLGFGVMSILIPRMGRKFGMERMLFVGFVILICGMMLRSISSVAMLFLGAALIGLGIAVGNVLLPALVKQQFPRKIGLMTSIYSTTMIMIASVASGLSVPLSHGLGLGWKNTLGLWTIPAVIAALIWLPQLRARGAKTASSIPSPSSGTKLWKSFLAWQVTMFMGFQSFAFYVSIAWLPEILHDKGMSVSLAGWMLSLMIFVGVPTAFIAPVLADRLKNQRAMALAIGVMYLLGIGGLFIGGNLFFIILYVIFIGVAFGACLSLSLAFFGLRANNASQAAELSGMAQSFGYLLAAAGPILIGFLFDLTHAWTLPLISLLIVGVIMTMAGMGAGRDKLI